ncbi:MAG: hypothetical protein ACJ763_04840 [Bdellovibrionia bacterium]
MKAFLTQSLLCSVLALSLFGAAPSAHAFPNAKEMQANYEACEQTDLSWSRRWGQYVVAFDFDEASRICREQLWSELGWRTEPELMSCKVNGRWIWAGYFCREIYS